MALPSGPSDAGAGTGEPRSRAARVLLAEDNPINRSIIRDYLVRMGYQVALAEHGAEAVEMAEAEVFDIILLDIQMPVMDGLEAASRIRRRQEGPGPRTPILALTAYAEGRQLRAIGLADFDRVLPKPLNLSELERTMREMLPDRPPSDHCGPAPSEPHGDPALAPQLRLGFLADTPGRMEKARELLALAELGALQGLAHYLVNSALAVQASDMAGAAKRLEAACLGRDAAQASACLKALESVVRKVSGRLQGESGGA